MTIKILRQPFYKKADSYILSKKNKVFSKELKEQIVVDGQSGRLTISEICKREGITPAIFYEWTKEFLYENELSSYSNLEKNNEFSDDDKFRIVLEGCNGEFSIAEICRRENITHNQFLDWSATYLNYRNKRLAREKFKDSRTSKVKEIITKFEENELLNYFESFIDVTSIETVVISDLKTPIKELSFVGKSNLVFLPKINDVRHINKHFEVINEKLPMDGIFIGCLETFSSRKNRMKINEIPIVNNVFFTFEFLFKRIIPKLSFTKKYYFDFTKGADRLLSKAEALGRLVSSGFRIMDYKSINGLIYFVVKKVKEPVFDLNPSYGPIYAMPRIGKNGKIIRVYKFRTMHPYSEYLQDYIIKTNGYADSGKPAEDFRIPAWGKTMRKFWLDELPQLINVLKGDMKLVGIRPVSERYFQDIPNEMRKLRLTQKPGCIPPYVALNRDSNVISVLQAEKDYLEERIEKPFSTDAKYFFKAIFNILVKHKRSA